MSGHFIAVCGSVTYWIAMIASVAQLASHTWHSTGLIQATNQRNLCGKLGHRAANWKQVQFPALTITGKP